MGWSCHAQRSLATASFVRQPFEVLCLLHISDFPSRFNSFHPDTHKPMHRECGFIRLKPDTNKVAFVSAQNTGTVPLPRPAGQCTAVVSGGFEVCFCSWLCSRDLSLPPRSVLVLVFCLSQHNICPKNRSWQEQANWPPGLCLEV